MVSALASVTAGQSKVKPLLEWDDRPDPYSETLNALKLEAVLRGEMREADGNSL
jgi:hypothetical protein